ncbi:hypothetical protein [Chitinophaga sp.]|uniref:hypothetical protein n=1 Tax=Chitinophaga sp. TaxID=1869181 RepID=UPI0031E2337E
MKLLTSVMIGYVTLQYRKNELYFYYNAHLSPVVVLIAGLILEFILFAILMPYCF